MKLWLLLFYIEELLGVSTRGNVPFGKIKLNPLGVGLGILNRIIVVRVEY